jgi:hypothetical protein
LVEERRGDVGCGGSDDDAIEGSAVGKTMGTVTMDSSDIGIPELRQDVLRGDKEGWHALDGEDFMREFAEECGLVSGTGTDLEYAMVGPDFERLEHVGDDVRLGDGLSFADGDGVVVIGGVVEMRWDELVARNFLHRREDTFIVDAAAAELSGDHGKAVEFAGVRHRAGIVYCRMAIVYCSCPKQSGVSGKIKLWLCFAM